MPTDYYQHIDTPLGCLQVHASERQLHSIEFVEQPRPTAENAVTQKACRQLQQYFAGKRREFDLPLGARGTAFQQQVWQALTAIPYGQTCSYLDIARSIQRHKAVRAVGAANGRNPLAIVVPCHRVIGKNGTLTGYAGGLQRKQWLLALERQHRQEP